MRTYSLDLRERVVAAALRGDSTIEEVAAAFGVGQTFVKKMLRQKRETGDLAPLPHGGGHTPLWSAKHLAALRAEVARHPDKTVVALRDYIGRRAKRRISTPTVSRALAKLDLPRKKKRWQRVSGTITNGPGSGARWRNLIIGG